MLSSIHPLGERARKNRWGLTAAAHIIGSSIGGLILGLLSGAAGALVSAIVGLPVLMAMVAIVGVGGAVLDLSLGPNRLPSGARQVNEHWIGSYRGWVYGAGFGVQLGFGFATIVTSAIVYLLVPVAMLSASVASGAAIGCAFGFFRGATVLSMVGANDPPTLRRRFEKMERLGKPAVHAAVVTQFVVGALALSTLVGLSDAL